MKLGFSSTKNWCWHTRLETPRTTFEKLTGSLAVTPIRIACVLANLVKNDWFHSLPFQRFQALLTLFSKSFSSFPHGTCFLSVSNLYLALDEIYHPLCIPLPRNVTLERYTVHRGLQMTSGILTLSDAPFQKAYICATVGSTSSDHNSKPEAPIFTLSWSLFIRHY